MKDHQKIEKHFRVNEINPIEKFNYKGLDVYISEGGPYFDNKEFPLGFYESAFAIGKGEKVLAYQPLLFDFTHNLNLTDLGRRKARINSAKSAAKELIEDSLGILDAEEIS